MELTNDLRSRVLSEFREMPGLRLTAPQAGRLCGLDHESCVVILQVLEAEGLLRRTRHGYYVPPSEP